MSNNNLNRHMLEIGSGALRMVLRADIVIIIHGEIEIN